MEGYIGCPVVRIPRPRWCSRAPPRAERLANDTSRRRPRSVRAGAAGVRATRPTTPTTSSRRIPAIGCRPLGARDRTCLGPPGASWTRQSSGRSRTCGARARHQNHEAPVTTTESPVEPTGLDLAPTDATETAVSSSVQAKDVSFADFDVRPEIVQALADAGITHPFPIQAMTLPVALSGPRHHRPGQDRHRQDARLRRAAAAPRRRPRRGGLRPAAAPRQAAGARRRPHP